MCLGLVLYNFLEHQEEATDHSREEYWEEIYHFGGNQSHITYKQTPNCGQLVVQFSSTQLSFQLLNRTFVLPTLKTSNTLHNWRNMVYRGIN